VPDTAVIEVEWAEGEAAYVTLDGQIGIDLKPSDRVRVTKAPETIFLVRAPKKTYYEVLRNKLGWGEH
jgi:NAD+ kinase